MPTGNYGRVRKKGLSAIVRIKTQLKLSKTKQGEQTLWVRSADLEYETQRYATTTRKQGGGKTKLRLYSLDPQTFTLFCCQLRTHSGVRKIKPT